MTKISLFSFRRYVEKKIKNTFTNYFYHPQSEAIKRNITKVQPTTVQKVKRVKKHKEKKNEEVTRIQEQSKQSFKMVKPQVNSLPEVEC